MARYLCSTFIILVLFGAIPFTKVLADTVLYCSTALSTGFFEENGSYGITEFALDRYTVKVTGDFDEVEINSRIFDCRPSFSATYKPNKITCFHDDNISKDGRRVKYGGLPHLFHFNKETKRFVYANVSTSGYSDNGPDSDSLNAGTCEVF